MSSANPAVFLSYASQDAEAARRIAEALRGFGVEVWFDQNELRGGDQWDNNIRSQIKACSLFIPIISQTTQSRDEAYFRLEWKLADDRSHLMAPGKAFIVPVVIDDTPDYGASVPDSFTKAQWTRLPGGEPSTAFIDQIKRLTAPKTTDPAKPGSRHPARRSQAEGGSPAEQDGGGRRRTWKHYAGFATVLVAGALTAVFWPDPAPLSSDPTSSAASAQEDTPEPQAPDKSIAVLPFENRSASADDAYFTDGIHDDLLTHISRIGDIKTISRTSVMGYRDTTKNMRQIGQELGVATLLEGGVQRAGNQVRINVQLIDAATDAHLWAKIYTREMTAENIFAIQTEIATAIVDELRAVLSPAEQERIQKLPTDNLAALEAFFRGRLAAARFSGEGFAASIEPFEQAIKLDDQFAEAYAALAQSHLSLIFHKGLPVEEQAAKAEPLVERALELDPNLSEAYLALAYMASDRGEPAKAEAAYRRAIDLNSNHSLAYAIFGNFLSWIPGRAPEAVQLLQTAIELDPNNNAAKHILGEALPNAGRPNEARTLLYTLIKDAPEFTQSYRSLAGLLNAYHHEFDEAVRVARKGVFLDPTNPQVTRFAGNAYNGLGMTDEAITWYERVLALSPEGDSANFTRVDLARLLPASQRVQAAEAFLADSDSPDWMIGGAIEILLQHDPQPNRFETALARFDHFFPDLGKPGLQVDTSNFRGAIAYASCLLRSGQSERAQPLVEQLLDLIPTSPKSGTWGLNLLDARLYLALDDTDQALNAVRQWRAAGGRFDLTEDYYYYWLEPLFDHPEFQRINREMVAELAEQRANVERWEANGELAPIPTLPEETL